MWRRSEFARAAGRDKERCAKPCRRVAGAERLAAESCRTGLVEAGPADRAAVAPVAGPARRRPGLRAIWRQLWQCRQKLSSLWPTRFSYVRSLLGSTTFAY